MGWLRSGLLREAFFKRRFNSGEALGNAAELMAVGDGFGIQLSADLARFGAHMRHVIFDPAEADAKQRETGADAGARQGQLECTTSAPDQAGSLVLAEARVAECSISEHSAARSTTIDGPQFGPYVRTCAKLPYSLT